MRAWEGNAKFVKQLETVQMTAATKVLGWSSTTSNTVSRAELGVYPLRPNRDAMKLKWQNKVRNVPKKEVANHSCQGCTGMGESSQRRTGIRQISNSRKYGSIFFRRKRRRGATAVHRQVCGLQDRNKRRIEIMEQLALRNKVKEEEHLKIYGGLG